MKKLFIITALVFFSACNNASTDQPEAPTEKLAEIEEVSVAENQLNSAMTTLNIKGYLRNACENIKDLSTSRTDNNFYIFITVEEKGEVCAQVTSPFQRIVNLNTKDLPGGKYNVTVNNQGKAEFSL